MKIINVRQYQVIVDEPVAAVIGDYWITPRVGVNTKTGERPLAAKLRMMLTSKETHRTTTLAALIRRVMNAPRFTNPPLPPGWSYEEPVDMRVKFCAEDWLREVPQDISPRFCPPPFPPGRAWPVSGRHPVQAIVIDEDFTPREAIYALDTASGFLVKYNSRSLIEDICGERSAKRILGKSLYDYRREAFIL